MILSVHQPTFFPHYQFFEKVRKSDKFVFFCSAQYEKAGYQNRFWMNNKWYTMSVNHGEIPIYDKQYINSEKDWNRIKSSLPEYRYILNIFDDCFKYSTNLQNINVDIIERIWQILGIKKEWYEFIDNFIPELDKTDKLIYLCRQYKADTYLSGIGAKKYLDESKFGKAGIKLIWQKETKAVGKPILEVLKERL